MQITTPKPQYAKNQVCSAEKPNNPGSLFVVFLYYIQTYELRTICNIKAVKWFCQMKCFRILINYLCYSFDYLLDESI